MYLELALIVLLGVGLSYPLSKYLGFILSGEFANSSKYARIVEHYAFKFCGVDLEWQDWKSYFLSFVTLSVVLIGFGFICLESQYYLPFNPQGLEGVESSLAFNIVVSFISGTNWQSYAGETTLSYFSQCLLTLLAFVSTAMGICIAVAIIRGIVNQNQEPLGKVFGNFWVDFIRVNLYVLLPICTLISVFFVSQGAIQNFADYTNFIGIDGTKNILPQGPVAAQESIKFLGANGGGFFGASSAHPFENPTPLTNFTQMFIMLLIPSTLVVLYSKMIDKPKHGIIIICLMTAMLFLSAIFVAKGEAYQVGSTNMNFEGKEIRFGLGESAIFASLSAATCGAANSALISFNPESIIYMLSTMLFGGAIFGGVGSGLCSLLLYVVMAVFIAGMMAGRTPKFLGKTIEFPEIKYVTIFIVIYQCLIIACVSVSIFNTQLVNSLTSNQSLDVIQLTIGYGSSTINNGLAFGSFDKYDKYINLTLAICMLIGRFSLFYCMLKVSESLAFKRTIENRLQEVQTDHWFFAFLVFFAMVNDFLVFVPIIIIGPVIEFLITR